MMKSTFLKNPSSVGETSTCPDCDNAKITGKEETKTYEGKTTTKIRWANPDGSFHITKPNGVFKHQTSSQKEDSDEKKNQVTTISQDRKDELLSYANITLIDNDLWDIAIQQVESQGGNSEMRNAVAYKWAGLIEIWKTTLKSAEIGGVAYSSQVLSDVRGASKGSFHTPSAVKDLGSSRQVATLPTPPFFSENIRWIAKCVKHGVICNEDDYKCKQCVEEYMDRQFATGGTINRGLLL